MKPPKEATRPGGNAVAFDWALMKAYTGKTPWMLAGGLTRTVNLQARIHADDGEPEGSRSNFMSASRYRPGVR